jgi:Restriction endonuclease
VRLPQDIANLLAVAIRDVIWFKRNVLAFLKDCDIPRAIMVEVEGMQSEPTIKIVHFVLDRLAEKGDEGATATRAMLTKMYYWKDVHTIPAERRATAIESLKALQTAYQKYQAQEKYQREQEVRMHAERVQRVQMSGLDHARLQSFRDEFDAIYSLGDLQERGNQFQDLMNRIFKYYCEDSKGDFKRTGEQIDGLFYFEKHWWYVEVRWKEEKACAADVSVLRDRARGAFGGDTKGLFISFNGYTDECKQSMAGAGDERVILFDGYDLRCVLDCQIAFDVLLAEKQADVVQNKRAFVGATEIIERRGGSEK